MRETKFDSVLDGTISSRKRSVWWGIAIWAGILPLLVALIKCTSYEGPDAALAAQVAPAQGQPAAPGVRPKPGDPQQGEPEIKGLPKGFEKVVAVTSDRPPFNTSVPGSLVRELARQALLIAAEEELGLATLDFSIGESIPSGNAAAGPFIVRTAALKKRPVPGEKPVTPLLFDFTITITRPEFNGQPFSWTAPPLSFPENDWYEPLVEQMELMSRGALIEVLQKAGYQKSKLGAGTAAKPAPKLENHLDFVSQFAVIRNLHAQMRTSGETPEVLEGLVRAYANLGNLTDFHWSPASKGFKARALLYAQRLVAKYGQTPSSLAHRAYALALAGRHAAALLTIEAVRAAKGKDSPEWLGLIEAYCNFKPAILEQAKGGGF